MASGDLDFRPVFYSPQLAAIETSLAALVDRTAQIVEGVMLLATRQQAADETLTAISEQLAVFTQAFAVSQEELMTDLTALDAAVSSMESQVSQNTDATASAATLLDQLAQIIRDNATDPAALAALADRISSSADAEASNNAALAAAVAANTPAAPPQ